MSEELKDFKFKGSVWFEDEWLPVTENTEDFLKAYWEGCKIILDNMDNKEMDGAIQAIFKAWKNGNTVYTFGNGGSASNASHLTADLSKTIMVEGKPRLKCVCLNDNASLGTAWTNDEGWESIYEGQLQNFLKPGDICIALSVHGGSMSGNAGNWSQNLMKGLQYSKDHGGINIGIAGWKGGGFAQICDHTLVVGLDSTAHVEAFQQVIFHALVFRLWQLVKKS